MVSLSSTGRASALGLVCLTALSWGCVIDWAGPRPAADADADAGIPLDRGAPDTARDLAFDYPWWEVAPDLQLDQVTVDAPWGPANQSCAKAELVTLSTGKAKVVTGNSFGATDEHTMLQCKNVGAGLTSTLDGPQLYYRWAANKDTWYKLTLSPLDHLQYLYVFSSGACTYKTISADCQSGGLNGAVIAVLDGATGALYHKATANGTTRFAVDSRWYHNGGKFKATIEAITAPTNAECSNATALTLVGGKVIVSGDIGPLLTLDEFPTLTCQGFIYAFAGPQVYYKVNLKAGQAYRIELTAVSSKGIRAYLFSDSCVLKTIQSDCQSGVSGTVTPGSASAGSTVSMYFKPTSAGTYRVAVDSFDASYFGGFTLKIEET